MRLWEVEHKQEKYKRLSTKIHINQRYLYCSWDYKEKIKWKISLPGLDVSCSLTSLLQRVDTQRNSTSHITHHIASIVRSRNDFLFKEDTEISKLVKYRSLPARHKLDYRKPYPSMLSWCQPVKEVSQNYCLLIEKLLLITFGWAHKPKSISFKFSRRSSNRFSYENVRSRFSLIISLSFLPAWDHGGSSLSCACKRQVRQSDERNDEPVPQTNDFGWRCNQIIHRCKSTSDSRKDTDSSFKWDQVSPTSRTRK